MRHITVDELIELDVDAVNGSVVPCHDGYLMIACDSRRRRDSYRQVERLIPSRPRAGVCLRMARSRLRRRR